MEDNWIWILVFGGLVWVGVSYFYDYLKNRNINISSKIDEALGKENELKAHYQKFIENAKEVNNYLDSKKEKLKEQRKDIEELSKQHAKGFPLLSKIYKEYFAIRDGSYAGYFKRKNHPAPRSAEAIKEEARLRRQAEAELKILQNKLDLYESISPPLKELEEEPPTLEDMKFFIADYDEEELEDRAIYYLTKEEYRSLSETDRNQRALDRYWYRVGRSNWMIGKIYERYIGYLYENNGYEVEYCGIARRERDLGRDLIAIKGHDVHIVQCKHWSRFKNIYENHVFQLFGTSYEYAQGHPEEKVKPVFYTSTILSEAASMFCKKLDIILKEKVRFQKYPCIKCNLSRIDNKTKIYHLPFDQQYDKTKVESSRGEFYTTTVKEAEDKGFRRALKYYGLIKNQKN